LLLAAGADGDHTEKAGCRSALWLAASMGHGPVVKLLLDHNCYVDAIDAEGRTVLSVAAAQVRSKNKTKKKEKKYVPAMQI
jgi:ankyrin repeat protein